MEETNNNSGSESDVGYQKVVRILKLKKLWSRRAEMIIAVMSGYEDIVGREQDVGKDKPFDLRAPDDAVRIDVKTQKKRRAERQEGEIRQTVPGVGGGGKTI